MKLKSPSASNLPPWVVSSMRILSVVVVLHVGLMLASPWIMGPPFYEIQERSKRKRTFRDAREKISHHMGWKGTTRVAAPETQAAPPPLDRLCIVKDGPYFDVIVVLGQGDPRQASRVPYDPSNGTLSSGYLAIRVHQDDSWEVTMRRLDEVESLVTGDKAAKGPGGLSIVGGHATWPAGGSR